MDPMADCQVVDNRPAVDGYKAKKGHALLESTELIFKELGLDSRGWQVVFGGNLTCMSGVGSSAATCVALARALSRFGELNDACINALAYRGESISHGAPSGVDTAVSTYGEMGIIRYQCTGDNWSIDAIHPPTPLYLVYAATDISVRVSRVHAIDEVGKCRGDAPEFAALLSRYHTLVRSGARALAMGDWSGLGEAMNTNHSVLRDLGVSCDELDHLVRRARQVGALGAKMTGMGRAGLIVALASGPEDQQSIVELLRPNATSVWCTTLKVVPDGLGSRVSREQ